MSVTSAQLTAIMPHSKRVIEFTGPLNGTMDFIAANTPMREAMFLAQIAHESAQLNAILENLNYSAAGLLATFPKYFKTQADADANARQPEKIANIVYAGRLGNGGAASGDGWRYRGRGLIQVTGKENYQKCAAMLHVDLVNNPAMLEMAEFAAQSAGWFWASHKLNDDADAGDIESCTEKINGGLNGIGARKAFYDTAKSVLGA
jgi:putative chitinase